MTTRKRGAVKPAKEDGRKPKIEKDDTLLPRIQNALERGLTVEMACAEAGIAKSTFYEYAKEYSDFSDAVTRAQAIANSKAVKAFASGLEGQKVNQVEIDEYTETRLDKQGKPYTFRKQTTRKKVIETPADWRAGEAWLKRRDPKNWSEKLEIQHNIKIELVLELVSALETAGISAEEFFTKSIARAQQQAIDAKR